jgi:hypothetical protein
VLYTKHKAAIIDRIGLPQLESPNQENELNGSMAALSTQELFLRSGASMTSSSIATPRVSTIGMTLIPQSSTITAHAIGILQIQFKTQTVYQLVDSCTGLWETPQEQFSLFLDNYFKTLGYHTTYSHFSIRTLDHVLPTLSSFVDKLEQESRAVRVEHAQAVTFVHKSSILRKPNAPSPRISASQATTAFALSTKTKIDSTTLSGSAKPALNQIAQAPYAAQTHVKKKGKSY